MNSCFSEIFHTIKEISLVIGKDPVKIREAPGFLANIILILMINETEVIASEEGIHKAMMFGANHQMGSLSLLGKYVRDG